MFNSHDFANGPANDCFPFKCDHACYRHFQKANMSKTLSCESLALGFSEVMGDAASELQLDIQDFGNSSQSMRIKFINSVAWA